MSLTGCLDMPFIYHLSLGDDEDVLKLNSSDDLLLVSSSKSASEYGKTH